MSQDVSVETKFYLDKVLMQVDEASKVAASDIALAVESEAKQNARDNEQVDTGFMVNSIYTITSKTSGYSAAKENAESSTTNRDGETVDHTGDMAPERTLEEGASAGVAVGAEYAVYQEVKKPFLFPAAETIAKKAGGIVTKVMNEMVKDDKTGKFVATGKQVTQ